jgi:propionyl-CoA carboxylase beta chain
MNKIELLQNKIAEAEKGGGEARIASQHKKGKLSARERAGRYTTRCWFV